MASRNRGKNGLSGKGKNLIAILELFKLKQTGLLILTGILGYFIASKGKIEANFFLITISLILAVAGTTGLNMYFDRDIDAAMFRTKNRPLPSRSLSPNTAFPLSSFLLLAGIIMAFSVNFISALCVIAGFFIDILLYTILLKKRSPLNIVVGSLAGGMPVLAGYTAFAKRIDPLALILVLMVSFWSMAHIWAISTYYIDDYRRASIPMLPVISSEKMAVLASIMAIFMINILTFFLYLLNFTNIIPFLTSLFLSLPVFLFFFKYLRTNRREFLKKSFKFLSPLLGILFIMILIFRY